MASAETGHHEPLAKALARLTNDYLGHFVPGTSFEKTPGALLIKAAPLFEKKRDAGSLTLITDIDDPILGH